MDLLGEPPVSQAGKSQAWRMGRGRLVCAAMSLIDSWLHPLRAYPRGFVLACFALTLGALVWAVAKMLKWSVYAVALVVFVSLTGGFALWLWG